MRTTYGNNWIVFGLIIAFRVIAFWAEAEVSAAAEAPPRYDIHVL